MGGYGLAGNQDSASPERPAGGASADSGAGALPAGEADVGTVVWSSVRPADASVPGQPADAGAARTPPAMDPLEQATEIELGAGRPAVPSDATEILAAGSVGSGGSRTSAPRVPSGMRLEEAEVLAGRFRIVRFIGRGGMGDVYEAEDLELGERVALKTVRAEIAHLEGAIERFRREIHLARKVTHENVCRIYDVFRHRPDGAAGGQGEITFFSMELLDGETLEKRLRDGGRMTPATALPIVRQMAGGLTAAHRAGVIHRDFKPANIMLVAASGEMRAVITDFGLARTYEEGEGLTLRGDILGTPSYMAPEQVTGGEVTVATDVYALGCVLYEMVTGAPPFVGTNSFSTAFKRLQEDPRPPQQHVPGLDPAWDAAILRCLERAPAERFAQARDVAAALGGEQFAPGPRRKRLFQRRAMVAAGAVALLGALVFLTVAGTRWLRPAGSGAGKRGAAAPIADWLHGPEELYAEGAKALAKLDGARAQELFEKAVAARHDYWLAHSGLAIALAELGHDKRAADEAKMAFDHAASLPREAQLLVTARYWQVTGHWDKAAPSYEELRRSFPDQVRYGLGLAAALSNSGRGKEALQLVASLKGQPAAADAAAPLDLAEAEAARSLSDFPHQTEAARRARQEAERDGDDLLVARALFLEALSLTKRRDNQGALAVFKKAEAIYAEAGNQRSLAQVLGGTAVVLYYQGNLAMAREKAQEALDSFKELGDLRSESRQLDLLAAIEGDQGNVAAAESRFTQAVATYRQLGDRGHEAQATGNLGRAFTNEGKSAAAEARFLQALALYRQLQDRGGEAQQLFNLAQARMNQLDLVQAGVYVEQALSIATAIDDQTLRADALVTQGELAASRGNVAAARASYEEALTQYRSLGAKDGVAAVQLQLANLELDEGHPSPAEAYARNALKEFVAEHAETAQAEAGAALAAALLGQHAEAEARTTIEQAERLAATHVPLQVKVEVALSRAAVAETSKPEEAIRILEAALQQTQGPGPADLGFDVRLALAETLSRHGDRKRAADLFAALEKDARAHGFLRIAEKAAREQPTAKER